MSSSMRPREICRGPRWELAVKSEIKRSELKMLAMANSASATRVGCHISQSFLGLTSLYWREKKVNNNLTLDFFLITVFEHHFNDKKM